MSHLAVGVLLAHRYRVESVIGSGGYATVYRVIRKDNGATFAMKEVAETDPKVQQQFEVEAKLLQTANHPNIPHGYDFFQEQDRNFLIMDYVEGKDLEQMLAESLRSRGEPMDEAETLRLLIPICSALEFMHTRKDPIIHRDIKPANIKLNAQGRPILIDFGLAKVAQPGTQTHQGAQGVTPGYAPPEQYLAQGLTDARTDIYGMGATMYVLLTGREPVEATGRLMAKAELKGPALEPARIINQRLSARTANIIDRAMSIDADKRQQTARELRAEMELALKEIENGVRITANGSPTGPLLHTSKRNAALPRRVLPPQHLASLPIRNAPREAKPLEMSSDHARRPTVQLTEKPLIDFGGPQVRLPGKISIAFATVELYWGLLCAGMLIVELGTDGFTRNLNVAAIITIGVLIALILGITLLTASALDKPITRRGAVQESSRVLYGSGLTLVWVLVNGLAIYLYPSLSSVAALAGLGFLGLVSVLTGVLSIANILA